MVNDQYLSSLGHITNLNGKLMNLAHHRLLKRISHSILFLLVKSWEMLHQTFKLD